MNLTRHTILILFMMTWIASGLQASSFVAGINLRKNSKLSSDTADVNKYTRLALKYSSKSGSPQLMKANIDSAEAVCRKAKIELPSLLHLARAQYFLISNDFNNASQEATIALKISKAKGETNVFLKTMLFLGQYNHRIGFFKESIDYYYNTVTFAKKEHKRGYIPSAYIGISGVYRTMGNTREYNKSLQMFIESCKEENNTLYLEAGYLQLGTSLTGENRNYRPADSLEFQDYKVPDSLVFRDFRKADSLLNICLDLSIKSKDTALMIQSLNIMGWNFYREKKYDSAIKAYETSLKYSIPRKIHSASSNALGNLGTIYRDMGKEELSLKYYDKSLQQAKLQNDYSSVYWVYLDMSDMYLRKRDTSNAFKNYVLYKKYDDFFQKISSNKGLADAKIRYDAENRNKELQLLSLKLSKQKLLIYGYTGLFVLCLAIGILLYSRSRINAKRRISDMNHKIAEITQANLRQQMNPHFIFNTLNSIQYYMYQHDKLATNNYLTKFSSLMRKVLENSQHTSVPLRDELDALNLYLELEKIRFKDKFDYQIIVDEEIDTILYKVPTMLIQPYVENSICHGLMPGEGKGLVKIDLELKKDYILCVIEDNGIGREAAQEKKMKSEKGHNSLGTQIVSSRLDLVNSLYGTSLQTIYTDLKNEKGEPVGTRVELHIPILT